MEIDDGKNKQYTDELTERISTLKNNILLKRDSEEIENTRKFMAKINLEAKTPTKAFCNQVNNSKKKVKLHCLLEERNLTPDELLANPNQKQYVEIFCQNKIKDQVRGVYAKLYYHKPTNLDKDEILEHIGVENVKT